MVTKEQLGKYVQYNKAIAAMPKGGVIPFKEDMLDHLEALDLFELQKGDHVKVLETGSIHEVISCCSYNGVPSISVSDVVNKYKMHEIEKVGSPNRVSAEPVCTCESLLYGCHCDYSKWKKGA